MIERPAEHAVGEIGYAAVTDHAPLQILARAGAQEIDRVPATVLLVAHLVAQRRVGFHVVQSRDRLRGVAERRVPGDVVDALRSDIDDTSVADRFEVLLASP